MTEETALPVESESIPLLHKPGALMRIAAGAGIVSWLILLVYLYIIATYLVAIFSTPGAFPTRFSEQISMVMQVLNTILQGGFYFLVLQGVSHLIYLGLDIHDNLVIEIPEVE